MNKNPSVALDKFLNEFNVALQEYDRRASKLTPGMLGTGEGVNQALLNTSALQMHSWAAGIAATRRHSLLKKIIEEIR